MVVKIDVEEITYYVLDYNLNMVLQPLEFSECLTDSPFFREKLHAHEKELARTNKAIKGLISQCKDLLQAANSK